MYKWSLAAIVYMRTVRNCWCFSGIILSPYFQNTATDGVDNEFGNVPRDGTYGMVLCFIVWNVAVPGILIRRFRIKQ